MSIDPKTQRWVKETDMVILEERNPTSFLPTARLWGELENGKPCLV